ANGKAWRHGARQREIVFVVELGQLGLEFFEAFVLENSGPHALVLLPSVRGQSSRSCRKAEPRRARLLAPTTLDAEDHASAHAMYPHRYPHSERTSEPIR